MVTNRGLTMEVFPLLEEADSHRKSFAFVSLNCMQQQQGDQAVYAAGFAKLEEIASGLRAPTTITTRADNASTQNLIAVELESISRDVYVRWSPEKLTRPALPMNDQTGRQVYIRPLYTPRGADQGEVSFLIPAMPLLRRNFSISDQFLCRPERSFWDGSEGERCWKVTLQQGQIMAALLFTSGQYDGQQRIALILRAPQHSESVSIDILFPDVNAALSFQEEMANYSKIPHELRDDSNRKFMWLWGIGMVLVVLRRRKVGPGKNVHIVDITFT